MSDTEATTAQEKETIQKLLEIVNNNLGSMKDFINRYLKVIILIKKNKIDNDLMDPNKQLLIRLESNKDNYFKYGLLKNITEKIESTKLFINLMNIFMLFDLITGYIEVRNNINNIEIIKEVENCTNYEEISDYHNTILNKFVDNITITNANINIKDKLGHTIENEIKDNIDFVKHYKSYLNSTDSEKKNCNYLKFNLSSEILPTEPRPLTPPVEQIKVKEKSLPQVPINFDIEKFPLKTILESGESNINKKIINILEKINEIYKELIIGGKEYNIYNTFFTENLLYSNPFILRYIIGYRHKNPLEIITRSNKLNNFIECFNFLNGVKEDFILKCYFYKDYKDKSKLKAVSDMWREERQYEKPCRNILDTECPWKTYSEEFLHLIILILTKKKFRLLMDIQTIENFFLVHFIKEDISPSIQLSDSYIGTSAGGSRKSKKKKTTLTKKTKKRKKIIKSIKSIKLTNKKYKKKKNSSKNSA